MTPQDYEEKRAYRRIALKMPVKYALSSSPDQFKAAMGDDLSASGMALFCEEALSEGTEIYLIIDSESPCYPALKAEALVHRVSPEGDDGYQVSVIFKQLS